MNRLAQSPGPDASSPDTELAPQGAANEVPPEQPRRRMSADLTLEEIRACTAVLEVIAADKTGMLTVPEDDRIDLLAAAGKVASPERMVKRRLAKQLRRERSEVKREKDRVLRATTEIRALRTDAVFSAPLLPAGPKLGQPERILEEPRACYVCKTHFRHLHHFYDAMCIECGNFNYGKRFQTASLKGQVALVTGGRVKIGYQACLMLLRAGARVIVTTRFPHDSAQRYSREEDFEDWRDRLEIHGLDLRHAPSVELLARHLEQTHDRLDILLNNAAQTVRRPPGFYSHLQELEARPTASLSPEAQRLLTGHVELVSRLNGQRTLGRGGDSNLDVSWRSGDAGLGIHHSAALSLLPYEMEQDTHSEALFPQGKLDADLQQVDLRSVNSWRLTLAEVETSEMLEVHLVNAVAPFVLCAKLKPLMLRNRQAPGQIVNVSAMEGSFSRGTKTDKHPHTNMAKAALNMMTRTSAPDYAKSAIYMNAVDTGWVTDEDPAVHATRKVQELDFQPPLDIVDGAARIVDPIFNTARTGEVFSGYFFKDYKPTNW